jgi:putative Mg2+ transporter-C (MgtC) family protein
VTTDDVPNVLEIIAGEFAGGVPDPAQLTRALIRLVAAASLGAVVGLQRSRTGKPAGLRTHVLVASGAALFALIPSELRMSPDGLSRVIQGVATGIGFIGGGAVLKLGAQQEVKGLTTAAGIWMTAGVGVAAGLGLLGIALVALVLTVLVLSVDEGQHERDAGVSRGTSADRVRARAPNLPHDLYGVAPRRVETRADGR